ncbi:MAG TPA: hypothetical protein VHA70_03675 [Bauldia sp.]|nr:hypothetical protein [Bauldia sp.]
MNAFELRGPPTATDDDYLRTVEKSLRRVYELLKKLPPNANEPETATDCLEGLHDEETYDPLNFSEVITLGVGLMLAYGNNALSQSDILEYTFNHLPTPFSTSVIHRAFVKLTERGLLSLIGTQPSPRSGRPAAFYAVSPNGEDAFVLALANHRQLVSSRPPRPGLSDSSRREGPRKVAM